MKSTLLMLCCCLLAAVLGYAQTVVTKRCPVKANEQLVLKFDYPKVHISTWDKNEVQVTARVNINDDENDKAFTLKDTSVNGTLSIEDHIEDINKLPRRYTIKQPDGKKTVFKTKAAFDEYQKTLGPVNTYSEGLDIDIIVEVMIPANIATTIKAKYGLVEMKDFDAPANIDAIYGGIDATLATAKAGKIQVTTNYGAIYSNLDLVLTDKTTRDFFTSLTAEPGKGPAYVFKSTYGKIYLRKP
jgi:hypothetical protein